MKPDDKKDNNEPRELYRFFRLESDDKESNRNKSRGKIWFNRLKDLLENHRLYCPPPAQLNDPFDCIVKLENGDTGREILIQERVNATAGVLSFSEDSSNVLMWSHYANGHRGVCLRFNMEVWSKNNGRQCHLGRVAYCMRRPLAPLPNDIQPETITLERVAFTKHADWHYENEWRMICPFIDIHQPFLEFPKEALTGVIFGLRMGDADRRAIEEIIRTSGYQNLTLYEASEDHDRFSVNIVPV